MSSHNEWIQQLAYLYASTSDSHLPCLENCSDCLCERKWSEKVYFLPYEFEYISENIGISLEKLKSFWTIEIPCGLNTSIVIGLKGKHQICPFLTTGNRCNIHAHRPFDCRSFPLMPKFDHDALYFELESYCPLVGKATNSSFMDSFIDIYSKLWMGISLSLPFSWKYIYWHSNKVMPELDDPNDLPRYINLVPRLRHLYT